MVSYRRILLKLSGEALSSSNQNIDSEMLKKVVSIVQSVLDLGVATARDNLMFLNGDFGPFALQVFWPSAGVHSIIIYSLVMMAFLIKMRIPRNRKIIYFILGILGTIFVNMIRIFSLSVYALKVTTDPEAWEEFHSVAGEIMFLPFLALK